MQPTSDTEVERPTRSFGELFKDAREERGLTRLQLSELSGIPVTSIWRYETSAQVPGVLQLMKLVEGLGTEVTIDVNGIKIR